MSLHHTKRVSPSSPNHPNHCGGRILRAAGCAATLLLALTGCFGDGTTEGEPSAKPTSTFATANSSHYPLPSSISTPHPTAGEGSASVTETSGNETAIPETPNAQASASAESTESAVASTPALDVSRTNTPASEASASETPRAPEKVETERAVAGERCGHIGRKGYLKTGAEIIVLRGSVDCAHALDVLTEYVTTPRADDNTTQHQVATVQDATCYWNPQYGMPENRRADRGAPECTIGENTAFVARLQNPDAPDIPFLMEPSRYDSGAGYYRFKSYDERTICELNPADSSLLCERRLGGQLSEGNGAVGRTYSAPVRTTRMNFATGANEERVDDAAASALHAESTTANTLMLRPNNVTVFPMASGKQITCFGEPEAGSMTCNDGNTQSVLVRGG